MDKGNIVAQGTHDSLLRDHPDGLYAKFVKEQEKSEDQNDI
jgi:ABC-type multidrug transport system fused ATPase/permease subunit